MKPELPSAQRRNAQHGTTLMELLVALGIMSVFSAMMVQGLMTTAYQSHDLKIAAQATETARTILDYMVYDLRVTGSGVPFMQTGFDITDSTLGTAPLPLLLDATARHIEIRMNERGINTVTIADYTPSSTSLGIRVLDSGDYVVGDTLYLSDHSKGGASGLRGTVTAVAGNIISINSGFISTAGATFKSGTIVHRVSDVIYDSPLDGSGIRRTVGGISQILEPGSAYSTLIV